VHGVASLDQEITRQARIIAYIDDFKLMLVLAVLAVPLLLLTRPPASVRPQPASRSTEQQEKAVH
jgi:DHA2 family multidrug resistance protein